MTFQQKLQTIQALVSGLDIPSGHYEYLGGETPYCVWAEDSEYSSVEGDNFKLEQAIQGTIDLYTKEEYDVRVDSIQSALKARRISFYLNSVEYEEETELIHYEWVFTI